MNEKNIELLPEELDFVYEDITIVDQAYIYHEVA